MSLKEAFKKLYDDVEPPGGIEEKVLLRIRERKWRLWKRVAVAEAALILLTAGLFLLTEVTTTQYKTLGEEEVIEVYFKENITLEELSKELSRFNLKIEGPYRGKFYIKGNRENLRKFLNSERRLLIRDS